MTIYRQIDVRWGSGWIDESGERCLRLFNRMRWVDG